MPPQTREQSPVRRETRSNGKQPTRRCPQPCSFCVALSLGTRGSCTACQPKSAEVSRNRSSMDPRDVEMVSTRASHAPSYQGGHKLHREPSLAEKTESVTAVLAGFKIQDVSSLKQLENFTGGAVCVFLGKGGVWFACLLWFVYGRTDDAHRGTVRGVCATVESRSDPRARPRLPGASRRLSVCVRPQSLSLVPLVFGRKLAGWSLPPISPSATCVSAATRPFRFCYLTRPLHRLRARRTRPRQPRLGLCQLGCLPLACGPPLPVALARTHSHTHALTHARRHVGGGDGSRCHSLL